jgi:hypothetical protein
VISVRRTSQRRCLDPGAWFGFDLDGTGSQQSAPMSFFFGVVSFSEVRLSVRFVLRTGARVERVLQLPPVLGWIPPLSPLSAPSFLVFQSLVSPPMAVEELWLRVLAADCVFHPQIFLAS